MKLHVLNTGFFKLDGGAMFGVVPKTIWEKTNPADGFNMCTWAMRSLLIEDGNKLILVDTGIGNKQSDKFFSHYFLHGTDSLDGNLNKLGFSKKDVTDVFLTHLHFDHCGGAIEWNNSKSGYRPSFEQANYWSTENHWEWATKPNPREKASFLAENIIPIQESGQLNFLDRISNFSKNCFNDIDVLFVDGHTESMMIPHIKYKGKTIVFMADLLPSVGHIPLPYVMGYDTRPLLTISEKESFLNQAADKEYILFLQHDSVHECCTVQMTEKGVRLKETFKLEEI
ncbi:MAG: MBL fold metallo-hydrolase [Crocinitomicaceae bacterium]|jgi:glyoxylase-like metal-dependent hydrolase (beta-lactamase superfamily II)|nr:MBL fold metallo-hydrolase [Crocinitomicaceae bacterium]MCF8411250.1 MBL fold metallo-hydrolase [Crocinitomicaceae bacterium]MCF8444914.1 MBL fold metallo-hydrolase [Crocinitomicaceae bacterium]